MHAVAYATPTVRSERRLHYLRWTLSMIRSPLWQYDHQNRSHSRSNTIVEFMHTKTISLGSVLDRSGMVSEGSECFEWRSEPTATLQLMRRVCDGTSCNTSALLRIRRQNEPVPRD